MPDFRPLVRLHDIKGAADADRLIISNIIAPGTLTLEDSVAGAVALSTLVAAGSGDFIGPGGATADAIVIFNGATGKLGKDSAVLIADLQAVSEKGVASGYASLDVNVAVVEPATKLRETSGATVLDMAAVADLEVLTRSGTTIIGGASVATHVAAGDPHTQYQLRSEKGAISGYASLDANTAVVEPATKLRETSGATVLDMAAVADGQVLSRSGTTIIGIAPSVGSGTARQEQIATQVITGTDTALTAQLSFTPVDNASVILFFNSLKANQGAGLDYTISGTVITWLASSGTAINMDTADGISVTYRS